MYFINSLWESILLKQLAAVFYLNLAEKSSFFFFKGKFCIYFVNAFVFEGDPSIFWNFLRFFNDSINKIDLVKMPQEEYEIIIFLFKLKFSVSYLCSVTI